MKAIAALLLTVAAIHGGTNAPTSLVGSIITFTNTSGRVHENVRIVQIDPDGIVWAATNRLAGGKALFKDCPPALRINYGYDSEAAEKFVRGKQDAVSRYETARRIAAARLLEEHRRTQEYKRKKKDFLASLTTVRGRVLQRTRDRQIFLLPEKGDSIAVKAIIGHPAFDKISSEMVIEVRAKPDGAYTYKNSAGDNRLALRYTMEIPEDLKDDQDVQAAVFWKP